MNAPADGSVMAVPAVRARIGNIALVGDLVEVDGKVISLTGAEHSVLEYLLLAGDHAVISSKQLSLQRYGTVTEHTSNTIQQFILRIRRALRNAGANAQIRTVRRRGWMWEVTIQ